MAKLSILHLSDIHIGNNIYNKAEDIAIPIIEALEDHNRKVDCVVITGDIFDGKPITTIDRKKVALKLLNYLKSELSLSKEDFIIVPGNHDLKRDSFSADFNEYKALLKEFYGETYFNSNFNNEFLFTTKIYADKKVAIVGLNSCMIETCKLEKKDTNWLEEITGLDTNVKKEILKVLENKKKNEWDDYGFISKKQLRESFKYIEKKIDDLSSYTVVACFHHHFYPFPEIYSKYGDSSIIRNFTDVIEKFQQKNVKIVLHGHKHLPIIRPVTNQKYLLNPESIFYVFSAGSIGKKGVMNRSFQQIDVFSPNNNRTADVCRFNYKQEELQTPEIFRIPPQKKYEQNTYVELLSMFKEEFNDEYEEYKTEIYESDNISAQFRIDDIINNISKTITNFDSVRKDLKSSVVKIQVLLLTIHYRINYLNIKASGNKHLRNYLKTLKKHFSSIINDTEYEEKVFRLLESNRNTQFDKIYDDLISNYVRFKELTAYISLAVFFTDLYLTFSRYGEIYYSEERIKHNVNIKLEDNTFHENIPVSTIKISSNIDRRLATIQFKCKNPTVHKIAVLIVQDFEKRINKIDDSFKQLGLKIYYLVPKVEKDNYDLDNFNFEAYIPTLLPLLTGDNLYKKKEVFIRELIQNALDAILLREDILLRKGQHLEPNEKAIRIIIDKSKNPQTGKDRRYLKIIDNGIGMDTFKIERYFTSIGRSFYVSDEFDELQKNEDIDYKPISNFGIGFLSAFMVCKEIEVTTKSYDNKELGLDIHIPNYDGCFFIKKITDKTLETGTTIVLYEDERKLLNPERIIKYIKDIFSDFQLTISIENKLNDKELLIEPHSLRRDKDIILYCPIENNNIKDISWLAEIKNGSYINKYNYGILLEFKSRFASQKRSEKRFKHNNYLNSGILLSDTTVKDLDFEETENTRCFYNFPSSFIDLDVAREKILKFKSKSITKKNVLDVLSKQGIELLKYLNSEKTQQPLILLNHVYHFFKTNKINSQYLENMSKEIYCLDINSSDNGFEISLKKGITDRNYVMPDFQAMIKVYYKILFRTFELQPKLFNKKKYDFEDYYNKISNELDKIFTKGKMHRFEKENHPHFNEELFHEFDEQFIFRFEKEIHPDFDENLLHMFDEDYMHMFNSKLMHMFDNEVMHMFDEKFMRVFEKDIFNITENEFVLEFENIFRKSAKHKIYFERTGFREKDENFNLLSSLILSNYINVTRRGKRNPLRMGSIYAIFYMFYGIVIRRVRIEDVDDFRFNI